jgi:hypothetical protein
MYIKTLLPLTSHSEKSMDKKTKPNYCITIRYEIIHAEDRGYSVRNYLINFAVMYKLSSLYAYLNIPKFNYSQNVFAIKNTKK